MVCSSSVGDAVVVAAGSVSDREGARGVLASFPIVLLLLLLLLSCLAELVVVLER